jgi:hypothetical protein
MDGDVEMGSNSDKPLHPDLLSFISRVDSQLGSFKVWQQKIDTAMLDIFSSFTARVQFEEAAERKFSILSEEFDALSAQSQSMAMEITQLREAIEKPRHRPVAHESPPALDSPFPPSLCIFGQPALDDTVRKELADMICRESNVPSSELIDIEPITAPTANSSGVVTQPLKLRFKNAKSAFNIFLNRRKLFDKIKVIVREDLTPEQQRLKKQRMATFNRLKVLPGTWVQWRGANIYINTSFKQETAADGTLTMTAKGWWEPLTRYDDTNAMVALPSPPMQLLPAQPLPTTPSSPSPPTTSTQLPPTQPVSTLPSSSSPSTATQHAAPNKSKGE